MNPLNIYNVLKIPAYKQINFLNSCNRNMWFLDAIQAGFFGRICAGALRIIAKRKRNKQALAIVGGLYAVVFWQLSWKSPNFAIWNQGSRAQNIINFCPEGLPDVDPEKIIE
jgi:hypothetical protein